jgi:hypothetical protein
VRQGSTTGLGDAHNVVLPHSSEFLRITAPIVDQVEKQRFEVVAVESKP